MLGVSFWWLRNAWICRPIWEPILHLVPLAGSRVPRLDLRLCLGLDLGVVWLHPPRWSPIALGVDNLCSRSLLVHTSDLQVCNFMVHSQPPSWRSVIQTQISMLGVSFWWLRNAWICRPIWEPILHLVPLAGSRVPRLDLRLCLGLDLGVVWLHPPRWSPIALGVDNLGLPGPCRLMGHRYSGWTQSKTDCLILLPWGAVCIQLSLFFQGCHSTSIFSLWLDDSSQWPEFIRNQGFIGHGISYDNLCIWVEMHFISLELGSYACLLNLWFSNSRQRHLTWAPFDLKSPSR